MCVCGGRLTPAARRKHERQMCKLKEREKSLSPGWEKREGGGGC